MIVSASWKVKPSLLQYELTLAITCFLILSVSSVEHALADSASAPPGAAKSALNAKGGVIGIYYLIPALAILTVPWTYCAKRLTL